MPEAERKQLRKAVEQTLRAEETALTSLKQSVNRLENEMMRRLWRLNWQEV